MRALVDHGIDSEINPPPPLRLPAAWRYGYGAYAASKLANILFTFELAARLAGSGVTANVLHPGVISTKLLKEGFGASGASVEEGAATSVHLACAPELKDVSGRYFAASREGQVAPSARDVEAQRRLWEVSERLAGLA
jgi:NAD(P)-dependent dehydrogenase (short-subunit alcohol dehydrogenase family)